jgi:hypothetical protein
MKELENMRNFKLLSLELFIVLDRQSIPVSVIDQFGLLENVFFLLLVCKSYGKVGNRY